MTDWVDEEAKAAKARQEETRRKFERRSLDAEVLRRERPRLWQSLHDAVNAAVDKFNGKTHASLQFGWTDRRMFGVSREQFPYRYLRVEYQESQNDLKFSIIEYQTATSKRSVLEGAMPFDVDDNGLAVLLIDGVRSNVDEAAEYLLKPVFQIISS